MEKAEKKISVKNMYEDHIAVVFFFTFEAA